MASFAPLATPVHRWQCQRRDEATSTIPCEFTNLTRNGKIPPKSWTALNFATTTNKEVNSWKTFEHCLPSSAFPWSASSALFSPRRTSRFPLWEQAPVLCLATWRRCRGCANETRWLQRCRDLSGKKRKKLHFCEWNGTRSTANCELVYGKRSVQRWRNNYESTNMRHWFGLRHGARNRPQYLFSKSSGVTRDLSQGGKLAERGPLANTQKKTEKWWLIRMRMAMLKP